MLDLTFGEQVKIILKRRGMTIKELAEIIGERTGKKMSRQNLTQRLGRDNFQEQDMRMIAEILECPFYLNILDDGIPSEKTYIKTEERQEAKAQEEAALSAAVAVKEETHSAPERDITIGELVDIHEELDALREEPEEAAYEEPVYEEEPEEAAQEEPVYEEEPEEAAPEEPVYAEEPEEAAQEEPVYEEEPEEAAQEEPVYEEDPEEAEEEGTAVTEEPAPVEERREKKHSWRDYLRRRKKKTEEAAVEEEPAVTEEPVPAEETLAPEEPGYEEEEFQEAEFEETAYEETGYEEEMAEESAEESEEPQEEMRSWEEEEEDLEKGDVNPYTGREYQSNSVRMHPTRIGYVQVYDRGSHQWTDMTEWAFLGYQERKKALLGKDYDPPIYLD